jgi:hypothetical protein
MGAAGIILGMRGGGGGDFPMPPHHQSYPAEAEEQIYPEEVNVQGYNKSNFIGLPPSQRTSKAMEVRAILPLN